jgi:hypothetical protein
MSSGNALMPACRVFLLSLLVLFPQSVAGAVDQYDLRVGFINDTPGFQLDIAIDGEELSTLHPGKIDCVLLKDEDAMGDHELVVKAFVQTERLGRRQIGRSYKKTFEITGKKQRSPAGDVGWYRVFTYRDFLPQLASATPQKYTWRAFNRPGDSRKWLLEEGEDETWRKADIERLIWEASEKYRIPERLLKAVIAVESAFNPQAVSCKGALGLMQLMPATCKRFDVRRPLDPRENIEGGAKYLSYLLHQWSAQFPDFQRLEFSLAAYHAGEGKIEKYGGVPPYKETRKYVREILKRSEPL